MSHWTKAKLRIRNPNIDLLKQALNIIAQELGGKVAENVVVYGWLHKVNAKLALLVNLPYGNGYAVNINPQTGEVEVFVDDHGAPLSAEGFQQKLQQIYTALAIVAAAKELGWSVENLQQTRDSVIIDLAA